MCPTRTDREDAQALLAEYAHARGVMIEPPIPIDDIVEKHLKIGIEFDDTHRLFGVPRSGIGFDPDILGAIFFDRTPHRDRRKPRPRREPGEGRPLSLHGWRTRSAHWRLHRHLFGKDPAQASLSRCQRAAERHLPIQPGQGADRMAGRPLCLVPADAAQAGLRRLGRGVPRSQAAGASAVRTDRPSLRRDRALRDAAFPALRSPKATIRRSIASPSPSPRSSSSRRSPCASGSKSSGCCTATVPLQRLLSDGS